nr:hypothetical protein [Tanacetum cinerariifolium]
MRGTLMSSSILRIMKLVGNVNLPTSTSIFLAISTGYWNDLSASLTLILVGFRVLRDNFTYKEYGIRHSGSNVEKRYVDSDSSDHVEEFSVLGLHFFFSKALRIQDLCVKKGSSQDERNFDVFFHFKNNEIGREGFRVLRDNFTYKEYGIRHSGSNVEKRYVDSDSSDHVEEFSVLGLHFFFSKALRIQDLWLSGES